MAWTRRHWLGLSLLLLLGASSFSAWARKYALTLVIGGVRPKVTLDEGVRLEGKAGWRGPKAKLTYEWSSLDGPGLPYEADLSAAKLVLGRDALQAGETYRLQLRVTADYHDPEEDEDRTTEALSAVSFTVNAPPQGGRCVMDVTWVGGSQASVTVEAAGWSDDDTPLQYRYFIVRNGKEQLAKSWSVMKRHATVVVARPGDTLKAICGVRDKLGDAASAESKEMTRPAS